MLFITYHYTLNFKIVKMNKLNLKSMLIVLSLSAFVVSCKKEQKKPTEINKNPQTVEDEIKRLSNEEKSLLPSLVAWYTFNGNNPLEDKSGNGNDISYADASRVTGLYGFPKTAYKFNGTSNFMKVQNAESLNPRNGISLVALVNVDGFYQGICHGNRIISKGYNDYDNGRYVLGYDDNIYYQGNLCYQPVKQDFQNLYGTYGNNQFQVTSATNPSFIKTDVWYLIVYTYDGTTSKLYINTELVDQNELKANFNTNSRDLYIGRNEDPLYPYYFNGIMDELRIYKTKIELPQVQAIYSTLTNQ